MKKTIVFYKPYGVISQFSGADLSETLRAYNLPKDLYPAGRLDKDSEGLLVLSNDGDLIHRLTDPKFEKEKIYYVQVERIPSEDDLELMRKGLKIKDYHTKPCQVKKIYPTISPRVPPIRERKNIPTSWLKVIITEGKNRQVRRMTAAIGFPTLRLIRVQVGKYKNAELKPGEYIEVNQNQIL